MQSKNFLFNRIQEFSVRNPELAHILAVLALGLSLGLAQLLIFTFGTYLDDGFWNVIMPSTFRALYVSLFFSAALAIAPRKYRMAIQSVALGAVYTAYRLNFHYSFEPVINLGPPVVLLVLLKFLPFQKNWVYRGTLLAVFASVALFAWLLHSVFLLRDYAFGHPEFLYVSACGAFLLTAAAINRREISQSWRNIFRPMTISFMAIGPLPIKEALSSDFSPAMILSGGLWILGGFGLFAGLILTFHISLEPIAALTNGHVLLSLTLALARWIKVISAIMGFFAITCGGARILGVPVSYPILSPWLATNFADYWRRANFARYCFYQKVFLNQFGPTLSFSQMAIRTMFVFSMSSIVNIHHGFSIQHFLRWQIEGLLTAVSLIFVQIQQRKKIRDYLAQGLATQTKPSLIQSLKLWTLRLIVMITHGFLFAYERR